MRLLFITTSIPSHTGSGHAMRSFQFHQALNSFAEVDVFVCYFNEFSKEAESRYKTTCKGSYFGNIRIPHSMPFLPKQVEIPSALREINPESYDYVIVRYFNSAYRLGLIHLKNLILDADDCLIEAIKAEISFLPLIARPLAWLRYYPYLRWYKNNIIHIPKVLFSNRSFNHKWSKNFYHLPNKIDAKQTPQLHSSDSTGFNVLFIGVLDYQPNIYGVDRFIKKVWSKFKLFAPEAQFLVAGAGLPEKFKQRWQSQNGVNILGFVEAAHQIYQKSHISISPIYAGSGTHIKIIESLLMSRTMVITRISHRGYESTLKDNESLLVSNTDEDFFYNLKQLYTNKDLRKKLETTGFNQAKQHHCITESDYTTLESVIQTTKQL